MLEDCPSQLDNGACLLLDEPLVLTSIAFMYDSKPNDKYCAISFG